ncbi:Hmo1p NDAI_0A01190 [Naumovozyma dairenensis CBS 421]|uniref:HMG box domain-containing protein n=1 Tax=Naumovozyma dairenensis (strain ATCC 10597 / BCRC 20456 / CBS 421 / NBRC 0211 / NRRL Y-12639) TaxID=1071378 RepID=G0W389_NAUDC|nr:hypothetical protein NDAI_0A01190 [Naumovozyma dairenensis CBS 421]CCD22277.1 hypothetical protein NDAI_0A01190 [Naumovozyma dairenensis CBS 421]
MSNDPSVKLKSAKDSLVASLFELSKSANQTASSIVDFYNAIGDDEEEKIDAFTTLTESLQTLTSAANQLHGISSELVNPMDDDKDVEGTTNGTGGDSSGVLVKTAAKKKVERDPNAPKKPLTVFFAYSAYVRQELRDERQRNGLPPLSSTEITQEISKKWKELNDTEKEKWKQAYTVELEHYQKEKQKYLEAKKNGTFTVSDGPNNAPVAIPDNLQEDQYPAHHNLENKRHHEEDGTSTISGEKKKKKKKKDKKKDKSSNTSNL